MPRRTHPKIYGQAHKEKRKQSTLKVVRFMDEYDSDAVAGVVKDVARSESEWFPAFRTIPGRHPVFVLDPRIVRREFEAGFRAGWDARKGVDEINGIHEDGYSIKLGKVVLLGAKNQKKVLACYTESPELAIERKTIYRSLARSGLNGFNRPQHQRPPAPIVVLGHFIQPVQADGLRGEVTSAVEDAMVIHRVNKVNLGPLQVMLQD